jgi:hypothetical protein
MMHEKSCWIIELAATNYYQSDFDYPKKKFVVVAKI